MDKKTIKDKKYDFLILCMDYGIHPTSRWERKYNKIDLIKNLPTIIKAYKESRATE